MANPNANQYLSPTQQTFVQNFSATSGLDPHVAAAWLRNEEPKALTNTDPQGHGAYNFLNIGITDSNPYGASFQAWKDPAAAGRASGLWLKGQLSVPGFGKSSAGIQGIARSAGLSPAQQIAAIQNSGWASGGEKALPGLYSQFSGMKLGNAQALAQGIDSNAPVTTSKGLAASQGSPTPTNANSLLDYLTAKMSAPAGQSPSLINFLNKAPDSTGNNSTLLGFIQQAEGSNPVTSQPATQGTPITISGGLGTKATPTAKAAIALAKQFLGTPYVFGGANPSTGFDCSGLVQYTLGKQGIKVPRTSQSQWAAGTPVNMDQLKPGDVLFFVGSDGTKTAPGHEGMYLGNGQFIEAPHTGADVRISNLAGRSDFVGARTFT